MVGGLQRVGDLLNFKVIISILGTFPLKLYCKIHKNDRDFSDHDLIAIKIDYNFC